MLRLDLKAGDVVQVEGTTVAVADIRDTVMTLVFFGAGTVQKNERITEMTEQERNGYSNEAVNFAARRKQKKNNRQKQRKREVDHG